MGQTDGASSTDNEEALTTARACDYATSSFRVRLAEIETRRRSALTALGVVSAASAVLGFSGAERLQPIMWLPGFLFFVAFVLALPPLMSVRIMHPIKLAELRDECRRMSRLELDKEILANTAQADSSAEKFSRATSLCTDNALRAAIIGLWILVVPLALGGMPIEGAAWVGLFVGVYAVILVELCRRALLLTTAAED